MINTQLARAAFIRFEDQPDGTVKTELQFFTALPLSLESETGQRLVAEIVGHMQRFPSIDRTDIN